MNFWVERRPGLNPWRYIVCSSIDSITYPSRSFLRCRSALQWVRFLKSEFRVTE